MKKKGEGGPKKPQGPPTFRPLESQLKELAKKQKEEEQRKKAEEAKKIEEARAHKKKPPPPPPPTPQRRESSLTKQERDELDALERSHDDEFFFSRLMGGVQPLGQDKRGRVTTAPKLPPREAKTTKAHDPDAEVREHLMNLVEGGARFEVTDDGKRLEGRRLDLADSTYRRLRRGELPIDARLDLHGKRAEDARDALERFLKEKRARRDRVVLVIHGRGEHSPAGVGVLRGEIAAWLSQGRASQHVAAFATAQGEEGGEGALYVLLRP